MWNALILAAALLGQVPDPPNRWTLNDSYYGDVTMTWDNVNAWRGVKDVSLPSNPCCGAPGGTFALHYYLTRDPSRSDWWLTTGYVAANFTTHCPIASSASDPPNHSYWTRIDMTGAPPMVTFAVNGTVPATQSWPAFSGVTLLLNLP